ncbi:MAG: HEPN domain-containing protein [Deltaproteobacteria bacterium]|nr:HEPN domain-containing protein [Deltaproteobacteria bacterium]
MRAFYEGACQKLKTAHSLIDEDPEAAYQIAYEAMLKASLAVILKQELRPRSQPGHHIAVIDMVGRIMGDDLSAQIKVFDEMRRHRNSFLYEPFGFVSLHEAKEALCIASNFVEAIKKKLQI